MSFVHSHRIVQPTKILGQQQFLMGSTFYISSKLVWRQRWIILVNLNQAQSLSKNNPIVKPMISTISSKWRKTGVFINCTVENLPKIISITRWHPYCFQASHAMSQPIITVCDIDPTCGCTFACLKWHYDTLKPKSTFFMCISYHY